jgi:tRNA (guanine-N7-)-methyltransferase
MRTIHSYVIRSGRTSAAQEKALESLYPVYGLQYNEASLIDFARLFGNTHPVTIEIGFGNGDEAIELAKANPDKNYFGIEVFRAGLGRLLMNTQKEGLKNIRLIEHDAVEVLNNMVQDSTVAAFHLFFPDPWPKKKHHKRRLVTRSFTGLMARKLSAGGYIYMASDWDDYAAWALRELSATEGLVNKYDAFAPRQDWRPLTRFEKKGLAKEHLIKELYFEKH